MFLFAYYSKMVARALDDRRRHSSISSDPAQICHWAEIGGKTRHNLATLVTLCSMK